MDSNENRENETNETLYDWINRERRTSLVERFGNEHLQIFNNNSQTSRMSSSPTIETGGLIDHIRGMKEELISFEESGNFPRFPDVHFPDDYHRNKTVKTSKNLESLEVDKLVLLFQEMGEDEPLICFTGKKNEYGQYEIYPFDSTYRPRNIVAYAEMPKLKKSDL